MRPRDFGPHVAFETLCGRVPLHGGVAPALYKAAASKTWDAVLSGEHCDIAIDGYLVLDGRLLLGRSADERQRVVREIERDLGAFLRRIDNGFFNIVVHDRRQRTTRIANDRFGALPLYLRDERTSLLFASTFAGMVELAAPPLQHDPVGLAELYWFGYQLGERTAWRGVERLPAGSVLSIGWDDGRRRLEHHGDVAPASAPSFASPAAAADHLFETMRAALAALQRDDAVYAVKLSAGMDSRFIGAAWPGRGLRSYTFGHPDSQELAVAGRLAAALGTAHTPVPLHGDFFGTLHAPLFARQGIVEWFHQALVPAMQRDGVDLVLDGLAGDVIVGGLTLKRLQSRWRQALGLPPDVRQLPSGSDGIARYLVESVKVPDAGYRPLTHEALAAVNAHWDDIRHDMVGEVKRVERAGTTLEQVCSQVIFNNRTRRHISLQGSVCRPEVETLYPFLDRRFLALLGAFPTRWVASKRLYLELYARHYAQVRKVPSTHSMLPFSAAPPLHLGGRVLRYGLERAGGWVMQRTGGRRHPWLSDGVPWRRWLAFDPALQDGARAWLQPSTVFDAQAHERALAQLRRRPAFSGTRFMYTASYCAYFR